MMQKDMGDKCIVIFREESISEVKSADFGRDRTPTGTEIRISRPGTRKKSHLGHLIIFSKNSFIYFGNN